MHAGNITLYKKESLEKTGQEIFSMCEKNNKTRVSPFLHTCLSTRNVSVKIQTSERHKRKYRYLINDTVQFSVVAIYPAAPTSWFGLVAHSAVSIVQQPAQRVGV